MSTIRAKWMKAVNMRSSFSKREKIRRKPFEPAEQALDLVAPAIEAAVVGPGVEAVGVGRYDRLEAELQHQLPGLVAFVSPVHHHRHLFGASMPAGEQLASFGGIVRLSGRQGEGQGHSFIRGNQMKLGGPAAARLADGLRAVFFRAPVPSGWTFTLVLSKPTHSTRMRIRRCSWSAWNTRSSTPAAAQRRSRV